MESELTILLVKKIIFPQCGIFKKGFVCVCVRVLGFIFKSQEIKLLKRKHINRKKITTVVFYDC